MRQERENALKERDDLRIMIESVLNETRAVIYIKNLEGKFIFVNGQFCRIFDRTSAEILGKNDHELFPKEMADEFTANDQRVLRTKSHLEMEEVAIHADQTAHTYLSLKFPLHDSAGALSGVCGISTDISEHRRLERELNAAKRMESLGLLAGGIAHDFNNIIEVILLVADTLLLTGAKAKPEWKASIESMKDSAQSAALLTRQLLAFGMRQTFRTRVLDIGAVVKDTTEFLENAISSDISFSVMIKPDLWSVRADPLQIEQVVTNLTFNARDAMPRGGDLKVTVRNATVKDDDWHWRIGKPEGEFVELLVADTGTGIDSGILERIFEPFFTTRMDGHGSGLGLATVHDCGYRFSFH
jgi:two-component system cell cycle sensor histidine kinase/response regulator CckA